VGMEPLERAARHLGVERACAHAMMGEKVEQRAGDGRLADAALVCTYQNNCRIGHDAPLTQLITDPRSIRPRTVKSQLETERGCGAHVHARGISGVLLPARYRVADGGRLPRYSGAGNSQHRGSAAAGSPPLPPVLSIWCWMRASSRSSSRSMRRRASSV